MSHTQEKVRSGLVTTTYRCCMQQSVQSPDLSPIELLQHILKTKMMQYKCISKESLKHKVLAKWNSISPEICKKLADSMPNCIKVVIEAPGGVTKY